MTQHTPGHTRAALAVLKELQLYERASAGCIAQLSNIIASATVAPDMLEALKVIQGAFDKTDGRPDHYNWMERVALSMDQVRAVIAKAEGR